MLIDSHCHLHDREFFSAERAEECLERAQKAGVEKIVCIGTSHEDSLAAQEFASKHRDVYWTYGIHPESTNDGQFGHGFSKDGSLVSFIIGHDLRTPFQDVSKLPVAIGEVGLDYHYEGYNRGAQIKLFEEMLQLAVDNDLPVSFHVREAFTDFFPVVANFPTVRGVVHSFTDSKKVMKRILNETDFHIGVNGLATYSTLPMPPLERILLETDAPFLAPVPYRGSKNEPAYVREVAEWLSNKLEIDPKTVEEVTTSSTRKLFGI